MLIKEFFWAMQGKRKLNCLEKQYERKKTIFIIFPNDDYSYNFYGLRYAGVYAKENEYQKIVFIITAPIMKKVAEELYDIEADTIFIKKEDVKKILKYLAMHLDFLGLSIKENIKVIGIDCLQRPEVEVLEQEHIFQKSHLVWSRMFNKPEATVTGLELDEYRYTGNDKELIDFFEHVFAEKEVCKK